MQPLIVKPVTVKPVTGQSATGQPATVRSGSLQHHLSTFITAGLATSVLSLTLATPASAELLGDIGLGAAASTATGLVTGDGISIDNALTGAAAGAAVSVINGNDSTLARDAAIGAIAGGLAGRLTNDDPFLENALRGAAAGAAINTVGGNNRLGENVFGDNGFDSGDLGDLGNILGGSVLGGDRNDEPIFSRRNIRRRVIGAVGRRVLGGVLGSVLGR